MTNSLFGRSRRALRSFPRLVGRAVDSISDQRSILLYANLASLIEKHGQPVRGLTASELKVFSQNGEDGVIAEIFSRIGPTNRHFVEFGIEDGVEGNCVFLAQVLGWSGLFIEGSDRHFPALEARYRPYPNVLALHTMVTPENIEATLRRGEVPQEFDLLSIDIDGNDYWIWKAIEHYSPRVVIIEYNSSLEPNSKLVQPYSSQPSSGFSTNFGASSAALRSLAEEKGYFIVHAELCGVNLFAVRNDLAEHFADVTEFVVDRRPNFHLEGHGHSGPHSPEAYRPVN